MKLMWLVDNANLIWIYSVGLHNAFILMLNKYRYYSVALLQIKHKNVKYYKGEGGDEFGWLFWI